MAEIKHPAHLEEEHSPMERYQHMWDKYGKKAGYALFVIILIVGGYLAYRYLVIEPNEKKASEAMFRAEEYYRADSANLALKGDNVNAGFLKIISKYGGTKAANLADFMPGAVIG